MLRTTLLATLATLLASPTWAAPSPLRTPTGQELAPRERLQTRQTITPQALAHARRGTASWYGPGFHGSTTANGERFDQWAPTAAHPSLPFGTRVRVVNRDNGRATTVRINDRGPYEGGRVIDLSRAAAERLGMIDSGTAWVELQVLN